MADLNSIMASLPPYELKAMGLINNINNISNSSKEFYISYNNSAFSIRDYGCDTTALHINETSQFLILKGDHRKGYEGLNFNEALTYFYAHIDEAHDFSEHGKIFVVNEETYEADYISGGY